MSRACCPTCKRLLPKPEKPKRTEAEIIAAAGARVMAMRATRRAAGLCVYCGKRPPVTATMKGKPGVGCRKCLDYWRSKRAVGTTIAPPTSTPDEESTK